MAERELLRKLGLTDSEAKVYLALLKIGEFTSKGAILKEARIAPSKVYHVLDKLIDKGLVSTVTKDNVKRFAAAPPRRIGDYLALKKQEIEQEEKTAEELLPRLEALYKTFREKTTAEVFFGWQGIETVYSTVLAGLKKNDSVYVLGASTGADPEKTRRFFLKYSLKTYLKGIIVNVLFNENARDYAASMEKEAKITFNKKFLFKTTPVEVTVAKDVTAIVMLKEEPLVILIRDKETAESFVTYFEELWKIAKS